MFFNVESVLNDDPTMTTSSYSQKRSDMLPPSSHWQGFAQLVKETSDTYARSTVPPAKRRPV